MTLISRLEAATDRKSAVAAFMDVGISLGTDCPEDFVRHVEQAHRSGSDTRAMGYLLLAALSLVPEGWIVHDLKQMIDGDNGWFWRAALFRISPPLTVYTNPETEQPKSAALAFAIVALKARGVA